MCLLHTKTLKLQEFYTNIPCYVILSHTWGAEEITFQDIQSLATLTDTWESDRHITFEDVQSFFHTAQLKKGYTKVVHACFRARANTFDWIWIDLCCIDKESSAELSEAIISMYQYYKDAAACYVYLSDVSAKYHPQNTKSNFKDSKWFTRGWTLQELLAPQFVAFFNKDWMKIGTWWGLWDVISVVTSIPVHVFEGTLIDQYSVAQRMSWVALWETTRPEDKAYCLMGIFGVSMSELYREGGDRAFMRLQQEIVWVSDNQSIFAWSDNGLHIHLPFHQDNSESSFGIFLASLLCQTDNASLALQPSLPPLNNVCDVTIREWDTVRRAKWQSQIPEERVMPSIDQFPVVQHYVLSEPSLLAIKTSTLLKIKHYGKDDVLSLDSLMVTTYKAHDHVDSTRGDLNDCDCADYMLVPLQSGSVVSACLEIQGDDEQAVEIDHFSGDATWAEALTSTLP
ncbi:hypothetical protein D9758_016011 [Tetrapyrgos nigripes]|uniref:Heterokaryon incompatibility domain-containing protein n=1 Tax=Tetrapyrgos nigripes TaxID=182062 RepID=A0A8H5CKR3_9AGAR|nr:hypothetical protein D9758_016011 [Tetrapyrgos nigripes]